ncbi:hypothetical protein [Tropicibacter alexandrii]|uniref:hypothetical protein n=1 Tax=Tropicibacter alexandrii TaxID=2267683 RepID=UPI00100921BE|nr:hypothetical protein [Tropicibacter alexandrii]
MGILLISYNPAPFDEEKVKQLAERRAQEAFRNSATISVSADAGEISFPVELRKSLGSLLRTVEEANALCPSARVSQYCRATAEMVQYTSKVSPVFDQQFENDGDAATAVCRGFSQEVGKMIEAGGVIGFMARDMRREIAKNSNRYTSRADSIVVREQIRSFRDRQLRSWTRHTTSEEYEKIGAYIGTAAEHMQSFYYSSFVCTFLKPVKPHTFNPDSYAPRMTSEQKKYVANLIARDKSRAERAQRIVDFRDNLWKFILLFALALKFGAARAKTRHL